MKTKRVALAVILAAVAVAFSPIFIPVGISKCFPAQAMVNVLAGVMLLGFGGLAFHSEAFLERRAPMMVQSTRMRKMMVA